MCLKPLLWILNQGKRLLQEAIIREIESFDERFDKLWRDAQVGYGIIGVRDRRYLTWRYVNHPFHTYHVFAAEQQGQLVGYLVTRKGKLLELNAGIIVDVLVHPDHIECLDTLIKRALSDFQEDVELEVVASIVTSHSDYFRELKRHGFIVTPKVFWFIVYTNCDQATADVLRKPDNWYLTWGDTDVV
jgi:hypothetical protein